MDNYAVGKMVSKPPSCVPSASSLGAFPQASLSHTYQCPSSVCGSVCSCLCHVFLSQPSLQTEMQQLDDPQEDAAPQLEMTFQTKCPEHAMTPASVSHCLGNYDDNKVTSKKKPLIGIIFIQ